MNPLNTIFGKVRRIFRVATADSPAERHGLRAIFSYTRFKVVPWVLVASLPIEDSWRSSCHEIWKAQ